MVGNKAGQLKVRPSSMRAFGMTKTTEKTEIKDKQTI